MTLDRQKLSTYPLLERPSKVNLADFSQPFSGKENIGEFIDKLPDILGGQDIKKSSKQYAKRLNPIA